MDAVSTLSADHYLWGGLCDGWHLVRTERLSVIEERMPPGSQEQRHHHRRARQFFYVLEGELTMEIEGAVCRVAARHGIEIPPEVVHQARNDSGDEIRFLVISAPSTQRDRVPE